MFTNKGTYEYNFKLSIRLDSPEFATDGKGVNLKEYSIWLEIKKKDGSKYRINLTLQDTNNHYISTTTAVEIYFDAFTDESKSDKRIFYQLFSEYYDSDGNWIGGGEIKKKDVSWKLYLDTVNADTPDLTPQIIGSHLWLTSDDGSQYFTNDNKGA